ncbi:unnamed protein product [Phaedon cochleariae]|uniref:Innexin n=1 Tax=Phaedon cochleariae TaxID=80249 RepID=A0A9N9SHM0_PHACE|nr:unnamed protein product [Phaedon cochleariae]
MGKTRGDKIVHQRTRVHQAYQNLRLKKRFRQYSENKPRRKRAAKGSGDSGMDPRDFFSGVYNFTQTTNGVIIDTILFRLHTTATVILLMTFSLAITTRQYMGHPIDCVHSRDIPEDVLNTYCWIHSTFTVIDEDAYNRHSEDGLSSDIQTTGSHSTKQLKYYQWVELFLFMQLFQILKTNDDEKGAIISTSPLIISLF